jgi:hypothetical protein
MSLIEIRRIHLEIEEIHHEFGPAPAKPLLRGTIAAVLANPYAGRYVEDIMPMMKALEPLGVDLARRLAAALGGPAAIEGYGKGAIIGSAGELEHGALWHVPGGYAMREILGNAKAIVPSAKKVGVPGTRLDVPITHVNASYVRSHFDAIEAGVPGAPRGDELIVILAMTTGARIHARVGGLAAHEIKGVDGLR